MSLLKIEHLRKVFPDVTPLQDVSAEIEKGDVIAVIGPSGTGKSTFLRCLNRLEEPSSGTVTLDGEVITDPRCDIYKVRRKMGMVFQSFNLFNNLNVIDNVTVGPIKLLKLPKEEARKEGLLLLERVGLRDKAENYPEELSGGQKQRVAIARAIAMKPEILLFDEPTSALDLAMIGEVLYVIRSLAEEGMTMLIVTHEMKFARDISNRVFFLEDGEIYEEGTPEQIFDHPRKEKTIQFIRHLKTLNLVFRSREVDYSKAILQIEEFSRSAMLDRITARNLMLMFEETVAQNLLGELIRHPEGFPLEISMSFSEGGAEGTFELDWGGPRYDLTASEKKISNRIVKGLSRDVRYEYDGRNHVRILL